MSDLSTFLGNDALEFEQGEDDTRVELRFVHCGPDALEIAWEAREPEAGIELDTHAVMALIAVLNDWMLR